MAQTAVKNFAVDLYGHTADERGIDKIFSTDFSVLYRFQFTDQLFFFTVAQGRGAGDPGEKNLLGSIEKRMKFFCGLVKRGDPAFFAKKLDKRKHVVGQCFRKDLVYGMQPFFQG